jgi:hypothetical protein
MPDPAECQTSAGRRASRPGFRAALREPATAGLARSALHRVAAGDRNRGEVVMKFAEKICLRGGAKTSPPFPIP